jgi:ligand-binding sensor domain-containing protein/signal transduction histidine kinase
MLFFLKGTTTVMTFRQLLTGVLLLFNFIYTCAQEVTFEHINARNGLSHNSVLTIVQDSKGLMWFGTYGGLNKYDGYKIINYKAEYGDKNSIHTNPIVCIYEAKDGTLWLGTYGGGVIRYDRKINQFIEYKNLHLDSTTKLRVNVRSIFEDNDGALWFATSEGLDKFDNQTNTFTNYHFESDIHADNNVVSIQKDTSGKLWLGTYLGLKLFNTKTGAFEKTYKPEPQNNNTLSHPNVLTVYQDNQGLIWMGTEGGGLNLLNPATDQIIQYKNDPQNENSISDNIIHDIKEFEPGKLWIATENGVNIFDIRNKTFQHILNDPKVSTSLTNNNVRCLYKDQGGVVWIGTEGGGINKMDSQKKQFNLYQSDAAKINSLSNNNVFGVTEDANGNIWVGTIGGGLNKFDPKTKVFTHFAPQPNDSHNIRSLKILSMSIGPSQNLWMGTDREGLWMIPAKSLGDMNRPNFIKFYADQKPNALKSNVVYSVLEDQNGTVWAGTWSRGIHKFKFDKTLPNKEIDYQNPTITNYRNNPNDPTSLSQDIAFSLFEDRQGTLWIGTAGKGLDKHVVVKKEVNGKIEEQDIFTHYTSNINDTTSLSNDNVSAMYESSNGTFWVGTSIGLNKMDREKGTFKIYSTKNGLPNNVVFGIQEDKKGNLWIATLGGLSKFNPKTERFTNYTYEDGLQDNMFNPHASCLTKSGEMYFGGPNGITSFFPDNIRDNAYKPQVILTDFKVFNKSVPIGKLENNTVAISNSIETTREIHLSPEDYVFSFEFSSSSYAIPSKNKFAYKMEGFDEAWVYTDANNRTATYTNLNPGKYVFKVKASNCDDIWSTEERSVLIFIAPPFWQTMWFRVLLILSISGLMLTIFKIRVNNIEKQKTYLENQVSQRTKEILQQKEEIESQKENIEEKNITLEKQYYEIEEARKLIKEKNQQLEQYNATLESSVKERTEQLRQTFDNLAETNKELDQFVYRSAHDLKGPLARIIGLCYLGTLETTDPKIVELLKRMEVTTEEMSSKLSRLMRIHEFNTVELSLTKINYQELLNEVIGEIKAAYDCKDIEIKTIIDSDHQFKSDKELLKKLLKNLIENSVKYKDEQKQNRYVHIAVQSTNNLMEISIADNGIGIPQNQADRVFDLFVTATENIQGFGLGLYEAKLIARRLHGSIKLNYPDNGDTEFVITI